jgi:dTDP-4-dehydrorhamnose 3,5-epimerase
VIVEPLGIPDVCLITPLLVLDERGFFIESWQDERFRREVADVTFVQDNHSRSVRGTVRGLHFQIAHAQGKLVRCTRGRIFDVAVDVRRASPTFGRAVTAELSDENHQQLWIPAGFAHGFMVLSDTADTQYKVTDRYDPASERTLLWNDPALAIPWPSLGDMTLILSNKDRQGRPLKDLEVQP